MKKYSGDLACCSKCHCKVIKTAYVKDLFGVGYMERICTRCGHCWYEEPLDKEVEEKENVSES